MSSLLLTCDRAEGLIRAAVWDGGRLRDLYVDRLDAPDLSGAIARGKVARVLPGQKACWVDCGLAEKIYSEPASGLRAGDRLTLRILSTMKGGKAWVGKALSSDEGAEAIGLIEPPPAPWQRALTDIGPETRVAARFASREDLALYLKRNGNALLSKEPVHPQLDEMIDGLLAREVPLSGGANIVIDRTEAMVVVDVNAGEGGSPAAVNLLAVREAARQIRLRNLSGAVVIDALKMKNRADNAKMLNALSRVLAEDPAGATVFGLTKLGLIEATRVRRGPALADVVGGEGAYG